VLWRGLGGLVAALGTMSLRRYKVQVESTWGVA
jgi:hypothetical protein